MIEMPDIAAGVDEFTLRCHLYAQRKLDWLEQHPDAEAEEVENAMRLIAQELGL